MVVIFLYDRLVDSTMTADRQRKLYGYPFERLGQERRISVLVASGMLLDYGAKIALRIKKTRNKYLHVLSGDWTRLEQDAINIYGDTVLLVDAIVGLKGADGGRIGVPAHLRRYLGKQEEFDSNPSAKDRPDPTGG